MGQFTNLLMKTNAKNNLENWQTQMTFTHVYAEAIYVPNQHKTTILSVLYFIVVQDVDSAHWGHIKRKRIQLKSELNSPSFTKLYMENLSNPQWKQIQTIIWKTDGSNLPYTMQVLVYKKYPHRSCYSVCVLGRFDTTLYFIGAEMAWPFWHQGTLIF